MDSDQAAVLLGTLVVAALVASSTLMVFDVGPVPQGQGDVHVESYPAGPEKPSPLNSSNVVDYTVTYEERLFYNDLLASHDHSFAAEESVVTDCTTTSVSNADSDGFHVRLECQGGITDASQPSESEEFTYSVSYRITEDATRQTGLRQYPFGTERGFDDERTRVGSSR